MIKEILWNYNSEEIKEKIHNYKQQSNIPEGISKEEYKNIKKEIHEFIEDSTKNKISERSIYITGHQPELFHPGILSKDLILNKLSIKHNAFPLHLVVDTDIFEFNYYYPNHKLDTFSLKNFDYHQNKIFLFEELNIEKRREFLQILKNQLVDLKIFLADDEYKISKKYIAEYINQLDRGEKIYKINQYIRKMYLSENQIFIPSVNLSDFIKLNSFKKFVEIISNRSDEFIADHNFSLNEYRIEHKIKNHAQPIPDLEKDELPFWDLDIENGIRKYARFPYSNSVNYSPRAITNTMFIRLFVCDFFIHGKGGGRYELISDKIIKKFFKIDGAPYCIASATQHIPINKNIEISQFTLNDINKILREIVYSPEKFIDPSNSLVVEKKSIQNRFKNPIEDKKNLNTLVAEVNQKLLLEVKDKQDYYESLKEKLPALEGNKECFENRTYPFFYYNIKLLNEEIDKII
jgi:hypothetical protein